MADNLNRFMNGYGDAEQFTGDPSTPAPVHRVDSGKVDPHLTRYVGAEAAREIRGLVDDMIRSAEFIDGDIDLFRLRLNDILGLSE